MERRLSPSCPGELARQDLQYDETVLPRHYYFPLFLYETKEYVWWQRDLAHRVFGPSVFSGAAEGTNWSTITDIFSMIFMKLIHFSRKKILQY